MLAGNEFSFDAAQHLRAQREVNRRWKYRWTLWAFGIGFPAIMFAWGVLPNWSRINSWYLFLNLLPWLLLSAFFLALIPIQQRRAARKLAKTDPTLQGLQRRFVDDAGLHMVAPGLSLDLAWTTMQNVVETDEFFLFYYNTRCAYYIPKAGMESGADEATRQIIRTHAGGKAALAGQFSPAA